MLLPSIKLRKAVGCQKLVGPKISQAKKFTFCIDGTMITIRIPRHKTRLPSENRTVNREIQLRSNIFNNLVSNKPGWLAYAPLIRYWDFYGPMFTGVLGDVAFNASIIRPQEIKEGVSFFHPRAFEFIIGELLNYRFADKKYLGKPDWKAPHQWHPIHDRSIVAAKYGVVRSNGFRGDRYLCFVTPLADQLLFYIEASINVNSCTAEGGRLSTHDMSNMDQLIDDIFSSVDITLSPEAEQQRRKALDGLEDTSLVSDYPPLKW